MCKAVLSMDRNWYLLNGTIHADKPDLFNCKLFQQRLRFLNLMK